MPGDVPPVIGFGAEMKLEPTSDSKSFSTQTNLKCIPFRFEPFTIFCFLFYPFPNSFCTYSTHLPFLIIVDDGGYLRISHNVLLGGESSGRSINASADIS